MNTWTDTTFDLPDDFCLLLCVTRHDDCTTLHVPGYALSGRGFSINFRATQIHQVEELLAALRLLQDREAVRALEQERRKTFRPTTHTDLDAVIAKRREREAAQHDSACVCPACMMRDDIYRKHYGLQEGEAIP